MQNNDKAIIILSKAYGMLCLHRRNFRLEYLSRIVFQCVQIKPHSSSLTNIENSSKQLSSVRWDVVQRRRKRILAIATCQTQLQPVVKISFLDLNGNRKTINQLNHSSLKLKLNWKFMEREYLTKTIRPY